MISTTNACRLLGRLPLYHWTALLQGLSLRSAIGNAEAAIGMGHGTMAKNGDVMFCSSFSTVFHLKGFGIVDC